VSGTCLISLDRNRYSVMARAIRRMVQVRVFADRILPCDGEMRALPRSQTACLDLYQTGSKSGQ